MSNIIEYNKNRLFELCRKYHVIQLDVFGSAATDQFDEKTSDIDFLVEFDTGLKKGRFDNFFSLLDELKNLFGRNVDLVESQGFRNVLVHGYASLNPDTVWDVVENKLDELLNQARKCLKEL